MKYDEFKKDLGNAVMASSLKVIFGAIGMFLCGKVVCDGFYDLGRCNACSTIVEGCRKEEE